MQPTNPKKKKKGYIYKSCTSAMSQIVISTNPPIVLPLLEETPKKLFDLKASEIHLDVFMS